MAFEIAPGCDRAFSMNFCAVSYIKHRSCSRSSSRDLQSIFRDLQSIATYFV